VVYIHINQKLANRRICLARYFHRYIQKGYKFLVIAGFITLVLLFISGFLGTIGLLLTVWVYYFFRDPERVIIEDDDYSS
jgi:phosphatidylserine decarboxylase